jgi:hypothetical protein
VLEVVDCCSSIRENKQTSLEYPENGRQLDAACCLSLFYIQYSRLYIIYCIFDILCSIFSLRYSLLTHKNLRSMHRPGFCHASRIDPPFTKSRIEIRFLLNN